MANVNITVTSQENAILAAHAILTNTTVPSLIAANGVANAVNQALSAEVAREVSEKSVATDITELLAEDVWAVTNKVNSLYQQDKIPASILTALQARAAAVPAVTPAVPAVTPAT